MVRLSPHQYRLMTTRANASKEREGATDNAAEGTVATVEKIPSVRTEPVTDSAAATAIDDNGRRAEQESPGDGRDTGGTQTQHYTVTKSRI